MAYVPINQADWECQEVAALSSKRLRQLHHHLTDPACLASMTIRAESSLISFFSFFHLQTQGNSVDQTVVLLMWISLTLHTSFR